MSKFKSLDEIKNFLMDESVVDGEVSKRETDRINCFVKAYPENTLLSLNEKQIILLHFMCCQHSTGSDHGSFGVGLKRRAFINTANSLNRKGLCFWDIPVYGTKGYTLTLDRNKLLSEDILEC